MTNDSTHDERDVTRCREPRLGGRAVAWVGGLACVGLFALSMGASAPPLDSLAWELPDLIGAARTVPAGEDDTLLDVAVRERVVFETLARLNPEIDPWMPKPGTEVRLPSAMIPPNAPASGLVVNLPEMRLYDYTRSGAPEVFPLAIGDVATPSPIGERHVRWKAIDPVWHVPDSILAERPWLPPQVPPGLENPLGGFWLDLGDGYGIHGTNNVWSIGRMGTHGCIRMHDEQVATLYARIPVGTPVHIVYQPVKLGRRGDDLYLEAHPDVYGIAGLSTSRALVHLMVMGVLDRVDRAAVERALAERRGIPIRIGRAPTRDQGARR
jgi:L,D-transpeptidase ErfK/SrfK